MDKVNAGSIYQITTIVRKVRYPEIVFALFLFAGFFKGDPRLQEILPDFFDLTIFFGLLIVSGILIDLFKNRLGFPHVPGRLFFPFLILIILIIGSLLYTPSSRYGTDKALRFATLTTLALFGPLFIFRDKKGLNYFLYTVFALSTIMVIQSATEELDSLGRPVFSADYLGFGKITALSSLTVIYCFLLKSRSAGGRIAWLVLLLVNLIGMLYSGSRMAIVGLCATALLLSLFSIFSRVSFERRKLLKVALFCLVIVVLVFYTSPKIFYGLIRRTEILREGGLDQEVIFERLSWYKETMQILYEHPFLGAGIGGFSVYSDGMDGRLYPHNIFLEIGSELGFLGIFAFSYLIWHCFSQCLHLRNSRGGDPFLVLATLASLVVLFLSSLKAGDLNDNRVLFAWIGLTYALSNIMLYGSAARASQNLVFMRGKRR